MLPHFPKAHKKMRDLYNEQMFEGMFSVSPILSQVAYRTQREGRDSSFVDQEGHVQDINYQLRSVQITQQVEELRGMTLPEYLEAARKPGIEMGNLMLNNLFQHVQSVTEKVGNVVDAGGKPLSYELFLEVWEKLRIDFSASGEPQWPSLVVDAKTRVDLQQKLPGWLEDPVFQTRYKQLVERKWKEFCERQACRRLVD